MLYLPSLILTSAMTLIGASSLAPALDAYTQPYKDAAKIVCSAQAQAFSPDQREASKDSCIAKKIAQIEAQIAPAKAFVASITI